MIYEPSPWSSRAARPAVCTNKGAQISLHHAGEVLTPGSGMSVSPM